MTREKMLEHGWIFWRSKEDGVDYERNLGYAFQVFSTIIHVNGRITYVVVHCNRGEKAKRYVFNIFEEAFTFAEILL